MDKLLSDSERLAVAYPDRANAINENLQKARDHWETLIRNARERKEGLDRSYNLHRFLADYKELVEWIKGMKVLISASELAKDVAGAEALLESHQEHKGEIDARNDSFEQTAENGQKLLDERIKESDEIRSCLNTLASEKANLTNLWEERRILYEQCMDLQLFYRFWTASINAIVFICYRDTEQAETWMTKQEAFLTNDDLGDSLDSVESLLKKHEDFEKSLAAQEEKIHALDEFATKLIEGQHYAAEDVAKRRETVKKWV